MSLREAAQQALEALEYSQGGNTWIGDLCRKAINDLRAALAEDCSSDAGKMVEPVQEPVAWSDADADAARLAMELEALLLSCKDTAAVMMNQTGKA